MFNVLLYPSFSHDDEDFWDDGDCGHANGHVSCHLNGVHCHVRAQNLPDAAWFAQNPLDHGGDCGHN